MSLSDIGDAIVSALRTHELLPRSSGWVASIAPGGSTDRTFTVIDPDGVPTFTARLARTELEAWLRREEAVLRELAESDDACSPMRVTRIEASEGLPADLLVHEHMPGNNAPADSVSLTARERLGEALALVHRHPRVGYMIWPALEPRAGTRADNYRDRVASLHRYRSSITLPEAEARILALEAASATLPPENGWLDTVFALLHGDLSPGNILWDDDDVHLIDWEFARDGDPAEDLAYLISQGNLTPDTFADIAEAYVTASGDPWAIARVSAWLPLVKLDAELWWADWGTTSPPVPLSQFWEGWLQHLTAWVWAA